MQILFVVNPEKGTLSANIKMKATEVNELYFYLNCEFVIEDIICDGNPQHVEFQQVELDEFNSYKVNRYTLAEFEDEIEITYQGILNGTTGCCPYVKEKISPDFTLLRWETFCYPIFAKPQDLGAYFENQNEITVKIIVPLDYVVVSTGSTIHYQAQLEEKSWIEKMSSNNFAIAIAKYIEKPLDMGTFYFLHNNEKNILVETTMARAHQYMNKHFGKRTIISDIKYITIPDGMGSFVLGNAVFIVESAYSSKRELRQLIHEFIHLGWNVKTDPITQKIRFFDEAFTSYFELRVMEELLDAKEYEALIEEKKCHLSGNIPIAQYGKYDCGDLSYTVGAFCLSALCDRLGREVFDKITRIFLDKYRHIPVNLEVFCQEYIALSGQENLSNFFSKWIYTTEWYKEFK